MLPSMIAETRRSSTNPSRKNSPMRMKRSALCLLLSLVALMASAQDTALHYQHAKYCMSFADYQADWWTDVDNVAKVTRSLGKVKWRGGTSIQFKSTDKYLNRKLKSEVFAIAMNDTLYVNLRNMRYAGAGWGSGYAPAFPFNDNHQLLFIERYVGGGQNYETALVMGLITGVAVYRLTDWKGKVCYLIGSDNQKATFLNNKMMIELLANKPDLLKRYCALQNKKEQLDASYIMPLLIEAGLVPESATLHHQQNKE